MTKINSPGSALLYSTYLGGSSGDVGRGIAADSAGNAYVTGNTASLNYPTVNAIDSSFNFGFGDAIVTKINASGSALVFSTYLGGGANDLGLGIAADSAGNVYVTEERTDFRQPTQLCSFGGSQTSWRSSTLQGQRLRTHIPAVA